MLAISAICVKRGLDIAAVEPELGEGVVHLGREAGRTGFLGERAVADVAGIEEVLLVLRQVVGEHHVLHALDRGHRVAAGIEAALLPLRGDEVGVEVERRDPGSSCLAFIIQ